MNLFEVGLLLAICFIYSTTADNQNVVFIMADDLGWNDVSFHGSSQFYTPNIDMLAYTGVALHRYYSHAICTPSRSALLTGKYAHKTGMQGWPIAMGEDRGIPLTEKLMPEYFKDLNYSTHLVGKWHVGHSFYHYLPYNRGFDSHYGHYSGGIDYYEYIAGSTLDEIGMKYGFDLRRDKEVDWVTSGYITDVYSNEAVSIIENHDTSRPLFLNVNHNAPHTAIEGAYLQAPPEDIRAMRHIELPNRRIFAAMVKKLDDSVGDIVEALSNKGILNNTIIVFVADNGGMTTGFTGNYASNAPMRGQKMSSWEGGIRVVSLIWSTDLKNTNHFWDGYMHISDWIPTLLSAIGAEVPEQLEGIDHWASINENTESKRTDIFEINDLENYTAIISGDHKLVYGAIEESVSTYLGETMAGVIGESPNYDEYLLNSKVYRTFITNGYSFDSSYNTVREKSVISCGNKTIVDCQPTKDAWCLYNIKEDPCEMVNLAAEMPELAQKLYDKGMAEYATAIPRTMNTTSSPLAAPSLFNYTWVSFMEPEEQNKVY